MYKTTVKNLTSKGLYFLLKNFARFSKLYQLKLKFKCPHENVSDNIRIEQNTSKYYRSGYERSETNIKSFD